MKIGGIWAAAVPITQVYNVNVIIGFSFIMLKAEQPGRLSVAEGTRRFMNRGNYAFDHIRDNALTGSLCVCVATINPIYFRPAIQTHGNV